MQHALKPGKFPGGSKEENQGVAYEFPDAKVSSDTIIIKDASL